ncbi:TlpA disulfide reductase family protein [Thalassobaculum sp.]|uniref:TlpA disulfide reductase family protein n=1 Tax=Thalassobaculum sp. TaxID=2022740 RepID=UPI0032ED2BAA
MTGPGSQKTRFPWRLGILSGAVAAVLAGAVVAVGATGGPPPLSGGYGAYDPLPERVPAPSTAFLDPDGRPIKLDAYRGSLVLLNVWATWCAPCVKELPSLDRLQAALGSDRFRVVLVSVDRKGLEVAAPFLKRVGVTNLRTAADPKSELARALGAAGLPTSILLDSEGRIIGKMLGDAEWDSPSAKALILHYLNQPEET